MTAAVVESRAVTRACASAAAIVALLVGIATVWASPAGAHAALVGSDPAADAQLSAIPSQIVLTFSEDVGVQFVAVSMSGPGGQQVNTSEPVVSGRTVTTSVEPTNTPGQYSVFYRIVSADGHPVVGELAFELVASDPAQSQSQSQSQSQPDPTSTPDSVPSPPAGDDAADAGSNQGASMLGWILIGGAVLIGVALAGLGWVARRRASDD